MNRIISAVAIILLGLQSAFCMANIVSEEDAESLCGSLGEATGFFFEARLDGVTEQQADKFLLSKITDELSLVIAKRVLKEIYAMDLSSLGVDGNNTLNDTDKAALKTLMKRLAVEGCKETYQNEIAEIKGEYRYVTADRLNVRSGPSHNAEVIHTLSKGKKVKVVQTQGDWLRIKYNAPSIDNAIVENKDLWAYSLHLAISNPTRSYTEIATMCDDANSQFDAANNLFQNNESCESANKLVGKGTEMLFCINDLQKELSEYCLNDTGTAKICQESVREALNKGALTAEKGVKDMIRKVNQVCGVD